MATSVPQPTFTPAGLVIPPESAILAGTQADFDAAFGGGLNPQLATPQGQLASSQAAIVADKDIQFAYLVNQFDPQYASGRFQDGLGRIYFLTRDGATATAVICTLGGIATTVVPAGTLAQDTSGNTYILLGTATIGSDGTVSSSWQNVTTGPIPCVLGTLTKVYQAIDGWDTITNPAAGVLGRVVESQQDFEFRRQNSVAINGRGTCPSIYANVFEVENVLDCFVIDNHSGNTESGNPLPSGIPNPTNYPLAHNSVYVAVVGGVDQDVANAIWQKKDGGCSYSANPNGTPVPGDGMVSTQTVIDNSGYSFPQPSYQVSFIRPAALPLFFTVQIANAPNLPSDIAAQIQSAIVAQFNGANGNQRARIGSAILAAQYYAAVANVGSNVILLSVSVGTTSPAASTEVQVGIDQTPTLSPANITVTLI